MISIVITAESWSHCCGQRLNIHIGSHREINLSQEALVLSQHFKVMSLHCNTGCDSVRLRLSEYLRFFSPHFGASLAILVTATFCGVQSRSPQFARRYYAPYGPYFDCSGCAGFPSIFGQPSQTLEQSFWSIRSNLFLALNKWFWRTLAPRRESRSFHVCVDGLLIKSHLVISVRPWSFHIFVRI